MSVTQGHKVTKVNVVSGTTSVLLSSEMHDCEPTVMIKKQTITAESARNICVELVETIMENLRVSKATY